MYKYLNFSFLLLNYCMKTYININKLNKIKMKQIPIITSVTPTNQIKCHIESEIHFRVFDIIIDITQQNIVNPYTSFNNIRLSFDTYDAFILTPTLLQASNECGLEDFSVRRSENGIHIVIHLDKMMFCRSNPPFLGLTIDPTLHTQAYNISVFGIPCELYATNEKYLEEMFNDDRNGMKNIVSQDSNFIMEYNTISYFMCDELLYSNKQNYDFDTHISVGSVVRLAGLAEFGFLMIKCGICKSMCTCKQKINHIISRYTPGDNNEENISGSVANGIYAYNLKHIYKNYHSFGKNYYILPIFGSGKRKKYTDAFTGLPLYTSDLRLETFLNFMHSGDELHLILGRPNILRNKFGLSAFMYNT